ncbi:tRNA (uracil-5-)-methyltransferase homolog B-like isoform X1 [Uloborus diversus]|uniref:tRNA (uracil-5-)-methyltransferase homolog B-like isoform X1 n=1 Tax=Uloborus diversus TaxID=327109 RepID=UPI002409EFAF|nr:tRNA (uracil-5-)-methyltransferase homolog B-like isoform X1 [Uloborus diversus]
MALTFNTCVYTSAANFNLLKTKSCGSKIFAIFSRNLRGSRLGREISSEEIKYQRLLRALKKEEKNVETEVKLSAESEKRLQIEKNSSSREVLIEEKQFKSLEDRVTPLKHLPYVKQLEKKHQKSMGFLRLFGQKLENLKVPITLGSDKLPCPVDFVIPSPLTEEYRNKDEFSVGAGYNNDKTIGFFTAGNENVMCEGPENLLITKGIHKSFVKDVQNFIQKSPFPAFSSQSGYGFWKSIVVRSNEQGDLMGIVIVHPQHVQKEEIQEQKEKLQEHFKSITKAYKLKSLYFQECPHSNCTHEQAPFELLFGDTYIMEELNGLDMQISPDSFLLSNTKAAESMYKALLKLCKVKKSTTFLDIYSGIGPLSMTFSPYVKECIGVEPCFQANQDAIVNAHLNAKSNVDFIRAQPEVVLSDILKENFFEDLVAVLNPSKVGISKNLITVLRECRHLKKIIYITTKPSSSMDNFVGLCQPCGPLRHLGKAFLPILALPVDLFPHTQHYGLVVMFQRLSY